MGIFQTLAGFSPLLSATPLGPLGAIAGGGILGGLAANEQNAQQEKQRKQALLLEAAGTRDSWARQNGQGNVVKAEPWKFGTTGGGLMSGVVGGIMSGMQGPEGQKSLIEQIQNYAKSAKGAKPSGAVDPFEQAFQDYQPEEKPNFFTRAGGFKNRGFYPTDGGF